MVGSQALKSNADLLKTLHKCKPNAQKAFISGAPNHLIKLLCEVCLNILKGNVGLKSSEKSKLVKYKSSLRSLAKKSTSQTQRRKLLQRSGFLGAILTPLLGSLLKPLAKSLLS